MGTMPLCLGWKRLGVIFLIILLTLVKTSKPEVLNPPYFNLAYGRNISASSTCGEDVDDRELYCKIVGSNWHEMQDQSNVIEGQACDYCDPNDPHKSHGAQFAIDGTESWWQSPPLSRGTKYSQVNLTIDLGQEFHVAYVYIKMGNSPRPDVWALERSRDYGKTYSPWQYFASNQADCVQYFGPLSIQKISRDDSVICETKYSEMVPLEGGEIPVRLLNNRPSSVHFVNSSTLQEWSTATNVRLRLIRPKTTMGHIFSGQQLHPTVTRRFFYSIRDINIGGRCVCNGHADQCDQANPNDPFKLQCFCQHNTWGSQCEKCLDGYNQYKWSRATPDKPFVCEKCNCNGHSDRCEYDEEVAKKKLSLNIQGEYEGGGVCTDCQHNTKGINCHQCKEGYYRPANRPLDAIDVCEKCQCDKYYSTGSCMENTGKCICKENYEAPDCDRCSYGYFDFPTCKECDCYRNGTIGDICERVTGKCPCKLGFGGLNCKECSEKFFGFPNCTLCDCNLANTIDDNCNSTTGQCSCKSNYGGRSCNECSVGHYNYPRCQACQCDRDGSTDEICDRDSGQCICKPGYYGDKCNECADGYYGFPNCTKCECNEIGSKNQICDKDGKCKCNFNFSGAKCSECITGYYDFPKCVPCNCQAIGSRGTVCDHEGRCICKAQFEGEKCNKCKPGYYNYPLCEECDCNPAGVVAEFGGCDKVEAGKLCECKSRVKGRICNQCKELFWNLQQNNPDGCEECFCNRNGTISRIGLCNSDSGKCQCKVNVEGRACDVCKRGTYSLNSANIFGCEDCNCDIGGAISPDCDKKSGKCRCKPRVRGRSCSETTEASYFPTLYQFLYEAEDWFNPSGYQARFEYSDELFPDYSWRGYAVFDQSQMQILANISITKFSAYRVVINYVNLNNEPVNGELKFTPTEYSNGEEQQLSIVFEPTTVPKKMLVTAKQVAGRTLTLDQNLWKASLKVDKDKFYVDYIVLIPQPYHEQSLFDKNKRLCTYNDSDSSVCNRYKYPDYSDKSIHMNAIEALRIDEIFGGESKPETIEDAEYSQKLRADKGFVSLNKDKGKNLIWDLKSDDNQTYFVILNYHTPSNTDKIIPIEIKTKNDEKIEINHNLLAACPYLFTCRQIMTKDNGEMLIVAIAKNKENTIQVKLENNENNVNVQSITLVPVNSKWSLDYVKPKFVCVQKNSKCISFNFPLADKSIKLEAEADNLDGVVEEPAYMEYPNVESPRIPLLVKMDQNKGITLMGRVKEPGQYAIVLHYYQPKNPNYEIEGYIQNGKDLDSGSATIQHCPSISGCRVPLKKQETNSTFFHIQDAFTFTLRSPTNNDLSLDYVLVVPGNSFKPEMLEHPNTDLPINLMKECMQSNFYLNPDESTEKCKRSIFSMTVGFNGGALPCQCNIDGSYDHKCKSFGGQCKCKPNVIGRDCSMCKTGYYGFPNCQKCNCPDTAVCHKKTGDCICPKGVTGAKCDKCLPFTFAFHKINGCVDCSCNPQGVALLRNSQERDLNCDLLTGKCNCKQNVIGRTCSECEHGFYGFSNCQLCSCDIRGTKKEICDKVTAKCFCKKNVRGQSCDRCEVDSYYLDEENPAGCTKCFCFGQTDRCRKGSNMVWVQTLTSNRDWEMFNLTVKETDVDFKLLKKNEDYNLDYSSGNFVVGLNVLPEQGQSQEQNFDSAVYISLPKEFIGNRIRSYGGFIRYKLLNKVGSSDDVKDVTSPDLVLVGEKISVVYQHHQSLIKNEELSFEIKLHESKFKLLNGHVVSRESFMMILVRLRSIFIRVKFFDPIQEIELKNVQMDEAVNTTISDAPKALSVEQCQCPRGYKGTSCEQCAEGYYRIQDGFHLGPCVLCNCNGHSKECDPVTGKCFRCQYNTEGDYCERCVEGYHGDATRGTSQDCMICACPLPAASNNFATSCEVSTTGHVLKCNCKEGYNGTRCDICSAGHYGRPQQLSQTCQRCECNGNINPFDPESCDNVSGRCLKCLNNAAGNSCERCAPWYFGDSVSAKNCTNCVCNQCGSQFCDHQTGECTCKMNVIGDICNKCAPGHYGFNECNGCKACQCREGAKDNECDDSGQCDCRPGVAGKQCEKCDIGYWGYSKYGCQHCRCNETFAENAQCDQLTGQCQCLPGVIGEKCEKCPDRWILIPGVRCQKCGNCIHVLLNETDELEKMIEPIKYEIHNTSSTVLAMKKFEIVKKQYEQSKEDVRKTFESSDERTQLLDRFKRSQNNINNLTDLYTKTDLKFIQLGKSISSLNNKSVLVHSEARELDQLVQNTKDFSAMIVEDIKGLEVSYENMQNKVEAPKLQEVDDILKELSKPLEYEKEFDLTSRMINFKSTLEMAKDFLKPSLNLKREILRTYDSVNRVGGLVRDMKNFTFTARTNTIEAEMIIRNDLRNQTSKTVVVLASDNEKVKELINKSMNLTNSSTLIFNDMQTMKLEIEVQKNNLNETMIKLKKHMDNLSDEMPETLKANQNAKSHARKINSIVKRLSDMFDSTKNIANEPLMAANAYNDITTNIETSEANLKYTMEKIQPPELLENIQDKVLTDGVKETVESSQKTDKKVETYLKKHSEQKNTVELLNKKYEIAAENCEKVEERLKNSNAVAGSETFDVKTFESLVENSKKIQERVKLLDENIQNIKDKILETEKYKEVLDDFREAEDNINRVLKDANTTLLSKNWIKEKNENIRKKRSALDSRISDLKKRIQLAKHQANNVMIGMKFMPDSYLELNKPLSLKPTSTYNNISMRFITNKPNNMLLFIGNGNSESQPAMLRDSQLSSLSIQKREAEKPVNKSDYIALEIRNRRITLIWDLGSNEENILTDSEDVIDNVWHTVNIERFSKIMIMTVSGRTAPDVTFQRKSTGRTKGRQSTLDLDENRSAIYVGGMMPSFDIGSVPLQAKNFEGEISNLMFDNELMGLWNLKAKNHINGSSVEELISDNNMRFNGNSYIILQKNEEVTFRDDVYLTFYFRTYSKNGLLFLISDPILKSYLSLEMERGKVVLKYDFGSGPAFVESEKMYNDDKWHMVKINRHYKESMLIIDGEEEIEGESPGRKFELSTDDKIYIGGYSGPHTFYDISKEGFEGCLKDLQIGNDIMNLHNNIGSFGVTQGCMNFMRTVSFKQNNGFVMMNVPRVNEYSKDLQVSFRFRTLNKGLMLYLTDDDSKQFVGVYLVDGNLVVTSSGAEIRTSGLFFNDDKWHYVTMIINQEILQLEVDDVPNNFGRPFFLPFQWQMLTKLFVGGVNIAFSDKISFPDMKSNFQGCIGDITFDNHFMNFADSEEKFNVQINKCDLESNEVALSDLKDIILQPTEKEKKLIIDKKYLSPIENCVLEPIPKEDLDVTNAKSIRFGRSISSRYEFGLSDSVLKKMEQNSEFQLSFKTTQAKGVLFYLSSRNFFDFVALFFSNGNLNFAFDCGSGRALVAMNGKNYSDNKWHTVTFGQKGKNGQLKVDDDVVNVESTGKTSSLNVISPIYIGAVSDSLARNMSTRNHFRPENYTHQTAIHTESFAGCIKDVKVLGTEYPFSSGKGFDVAPCSNQVEPGTFFHYSGGNVQLREEFKVQREFRMTVDIKPRKPDGIIAAVFGTSDYLALYIDKGKVTFAVDNGKGEIIAEEKIDTLCDGQWHTINVMKVGNFIHLQVDSRQEKHQVGEVGSSSTDTNTNLYIGGIPQQLKDMKKNKLRGMVSDYLGCLNIREINGKRPIADSIEGHVTLNHCPIN